MDWTHKALLTGMTVAAVLLAARGLGPRVAGLMAGLPVVTVPALLWLSQDQGVAFAAHSAVGSLVACAMAPWFATAFLLLSRRYGPLASLAGACALAGLLVLALHSLEDWSGLLLLAAAASSLLVVQRLDHQAASDPVTAAPLPLAGEPWLTATVAAVVSVAVGQLAVALGPYWAGVLSTLPLISACALVHLRRVAGRPALRRFVSAYALGILAKSVFVFGFAHAAPHLGAERAMLLAGLLGAGGAWGLSRWRSARPALPWPPATGR